MSLKQKIRLAVLLASGFLVNAQAQASTLLSGICDTAIKTRNKEEISRQALRLLKEITWTSDRQADFDTLFQLVARNPESQKKFFKVLDTQNAIDILFLNSQYLPAYWQQIGNDPSILKGIPSDQFEMKILSSLSVLEQRGNSNAIAKAEIISRAARKIFQSRKEKDFENFYGAAQQKFLALWRTKRPGQ